MAIHHTAVILAKAMAHAVPVGTGESNPAINPDDVGRRSFVGWIKPTVDMLFDSQARSAQSLLDNLHRSRKLGLTYERFQVTLPDALLPFDNSSTSNIGQLYARGGLLMNDPVKFGRAVATVDTAKPVLLAQQHPAAVGLPAGNQAGAAAAQEAIVTNMIAARMDDAAIIDVTGATPALVARLRAPAA